jgi:hypothetical protein
VHRAAIALEWLDRMPGSSRPGGQSEPAPSQPALAQSGPGAAGLGVPVPAEQASDRG